MGSTLRVYNIGLDFVSARTNKRHHHHPGGTGLLRGVLGVGHSLDGGELVSPFLRVLHCATALSRSGLVFRTVEARDMSACAHTW